MRSMRTSYIVPILLLAVTINFSPYISREAEANGLNTVVLQLKWKHQFQFAGYYAAVEKGFYREAGLDVELKEAHPDQDLTEELISGRADYLVNNPSALLERAQGKPIVALAAIFQHSPLAILSRKETGIHTPTDLIGRRIMFIPEVESQLVAMIINEGVKLKDIDIVPHSWDVADLLSGQVDAISAYLTDAPFLLEAKGIEYNVLRPITYGIDFYGDVLFTTQAEIDDHPERVKAFRDASIRGWLYAMSHTTEIADLIRSKYGSRMSREALLFEAAQMQSLILPELVDMGHMNPGRWQHIAKTYIDLGLLPPDFSLAGFLYDHESNRDYTRFVVLILVLAICLTVALVFVFLLKKMVQMKTKDLDRANKDIAGHSKQMNAIINGTTDAVFIKDLAGKYIVVNDEVVRLFGRTRDEIIGKDDTHFFPPKESQLLRTLDRNILEGNQVVTQEEHITTLDQKRVYLATKGPIHDERGDVVGLFGISRDITERKQAAKELARYRDKLQGHVDEQTKELKEAHSELLQKERLATLGQLTAKVSHELRNPLGTIQSAFYSIEVSLAKNERHLARRSLDLAERSISRCVDIIEELNDYARVKDLNISQQSLPDWLREVLAEQTIPNEIITEFDLPTDFVAQFDKRRLQQVVINIIDNALHALNDKDSAGSFLKICTCLRGDVYEIQIQDNGIGMSDEIKLKIFEPLFSTKSFGVGLGMVIVKNIVEQHHGEITIESQLGKGTTVTLRLPVKITG